MLVRDIDYEKVNPISERCIHCSYHRMLSNEYVPDIISLNSTNVLKQYKSIEHVNDSLLDCYISVIKYSDFLANPEKYIDNAFSKRERQMERGEFEINYDLHN